MATNAVKKCSKCGEVKGLGEYRSDKRAVDGLQSQCAECQRAASRAYARKRKELYPELVRKEKREQMRLARQKDPERFRQRRKEWAAKNPEKVAATSRAYRESHPEKVAEINKAWRAANADHLKAYNGARSIENYAADPQKYKAAAAKWQQDNPEKRSAIRKRWKGQHPEAVRKHRKAEVERLTDNYVKGALAVNGIPREHATPELIALKREQLAIKRMARELKKAATQQDGATP